MQIAKLARDLLAMCPEPFSSWLKPITTSLAKDTETEPMTRLRVSTGEGVLRGLNAVRGR